MFLTQGFAYDSAEQAEARFQNAGEDEYIYARYGNPTVRMFEERIALLEGAEDGFATASGMAAVNGALVSMLKAGDHVVAARALFGSCLYILEDDPAALRRRGHVGRWHRPRGMGGGDPTTTRGRSSSKSMSNPTLEVIDIEAVAKLAHGCGATVDRRQRLLDAGLFGRDRCRGRTWSSTRRPSISTGRGASSAA